MQKDKKYYDRFFANFGPDVHLDPVRFSKIAELCRGRVLDIGCGTGNLSDFYKGPYVGFDISEVAIKKAKTLRRKDAAFDAVDFTREIVQNSLKFDTFVMTEFLEHIDKREKLFCIVK